MLRAEVIRAETPSRTAKVRLELPIDDKFHTLPQERRDASRLVFEAIAQRDGKKAALVWLNALVSNPGVTPPLASRLSPSERLRKAHGIPLNNATKRPQKRLESRPGSRAPERAVKRVLNVSDEVLNRTQSLSPALKRGEAIPLFRLLLEASLNIAQGRGYAPEVSLVTFFCPLEIVAAVQGVNRHTVRRNVRRLQSAGLLDATPWKASVKGETRNAGYLWQVKMNPLSPTQPKLKGEDFHHHWRNLETDTETGTTAYNQVQQSKAPQGTKLDMGSLLAWALPLGNKPLPFLENMTVTENKTKPQASLEAIFDLASASPKTRPSIALCAAKAIAQTLNDLHSLKFYQRLLLKFAALSDFGTDWFSSLYNEVGRASTDVQEGFARRGGALLIWRLKHYPIWDELARVHTGSRFEQEAIEA